MISKCEELGIDLSDEPLITGEDHDSIAQNLQRQSTEELSGEALLKTIKVPANLANLSSRLPKSNYQRSRREEVELVSISQSKMNNSQNQHQFDPPMTNRLPLSKRDSSDDGVDTIISIAKGSDKPRP